MAVARPISITSVGWTGLVGSLGDDDDRTYVASAPGPTVADPLTATMDTLSDPGYDQGHTVTVRVATDNADPLDVLVELLDGDDDSVIASTTATNIDSTAQNVVLTLTSTQAALVNYANSKVRITASEADFEDVAFVWDTVVGATYYVLQIGMSAGASDVWNASVGDVLTLTRPLPTGDTYYSRVKAYDSGDTLLSTTDEQEVTV